MWSNKILPLGQCQQCHNTTRRKKQRKWRQSFKTSKDEVNATQECKEWKESTEEGDESVRPRHPYILKIEGPVWFFQELYTHLCFRVKRGKAIITGITSCGFNVTLLVSQIPLFTNPNFFHVRKLFPYPFPSTYSLLLFFFN